MTINKFISAGLTGLAALVGVAASDAIAEEAVVKDIPAAMKTLGFDIDSRNWVHIPVENCNNGTNMSRYGPDRVFGSGKGHYKKIELNKEKNTVTIETSEGEETVIEMNLEKKTVHMIAKYKGKIELEADCDYVSTSKLDFHGKKLKVKGPNKEGRYELTSGMSSLIFDPKDNSIKPAYKWDTESCKSKVLHADLEKGVIIINRDCGNYYNDFRIDLQFGNSDPNEAYTAEPINSNQKPKKGECENKKGNCDS